MTQEALKLALEWAEANGEIVFAGGGMDAVNKMNSWATAIKEALREHAMREVQRLGQEIEQEPVAWVSEDVCEGQLINGRPRKIWWECNKGVGTAFYTTPPQRTWVGLTDEEVERLIHNFGPDPWTLLDEVEARLKARNT